MNAWSAHAWAHEPEAARRARVVREAMTLEEKVALLSNRQEPGPLLGPIRAADGAAGIRLVPGVTESTASTALPAPIALAATWDPGQADDYGTVLGRELRATGHHVLLGPAVDVARVPLGGRTFESFGEDPTLAARLVVPEVLAIQAAGAQACVKHFVANNQETSRGVVDVRVDEATLRELYLPAFEAAVRSGGATVVMSAYNQVNGVYASHSERLLTGLLRDEWSFAGWVMSDFLANHSLTGSWDAGLDWELTDDPVWGDELLAAVRAGEVREAELDARVDRVLRPYFALHQDVDAEPLRTIELLDHHDIAREVATRGAVLLANDGVLPLRGVSRLAVIGPDAGAVTAAGGGSPLVAPKRALAVSVVDGLRAALPGAEVRWAPGADPISSGSLLPGPEAVPAGCLGPADAPGVLVDFWDTVAFDGDPSWSVRLGQIEMNRGFFAEAGFHAPSPGWSGWPAGLPARHASRWTTTLRPPVTGEYVLALTWLGSVRLVVDGATLLDVTTAVDPDRPVPVGILWDGVGAEVATVRVHLDAGRDVPIVVEYTTTVPAQSGHYGAQLRFGWVPPAGAVPPLRADAVALAQWADVAVVVARAYESEAMDRPTTRLPGGQDELIGAVAATGVPTVVVTMSGGPVDVSAWRNRVSAMMHAWYPGQGQGRALADLLTGAREPAGRLPITFPAHEVRPDDVDAQVYPGSGGWVDYREGTRVGYRSGREVAFAFGHGIGYATHEIDAVSVDLADDAWLVRFALRNTCTRPGTEVVQVYRGRRGRPEVLLGWTRVHTRPGGVVHASVDIGPDGLPHRWGRWDEATERWRPIEGTCELLIGTSAVEVCAHAVVRLGAVRTDGSGPERPLVVEVGDVLRRAHDADLPVRNARV
ncbi:glycoside hydrolase family 3 C-terminal domain-containing protein [Actinotalea sp. M2MS4P-6]|uniref:glycoside hydrolase family 3 C-terminal domain-containing protein n=1 Tax=Actinotalea sp. M2MS4P-6 TaxID=2983762 RepID=UPI0021E3A7D6|nr:glycoside hydrolase family 3 C-terminal domain-containing protein [Actinotalea sp. M2MS4P-6]MCV2394748.1 glycoside hydrolase family 3 C-terminal domain-containing protein [Actinotalea sp. M2MS4P-6]